MSDTDNMTNQTAAAERARLMRLLDAETISHQDRGQIAVRQWARAWINEQATQ